MSENIPPVPKLRQGHVPHKPRPKISKEAHQQIAAKQKENTHSYAEALDEAGSEIKTIAMRVAEAQSQECAGSGTGFVPWTRTLCSW